MLKSVSRTFLRLFLFLVRELETPAIHMKPVKPQRLIFVDFTEAFAVSQLNNPLLPVGRIKFSEE